ncbi:MAG: hypothetical protein SFT92_00645 [Rickettsiales bacterium]|nr:hypothetical protein [Rickettsiales bacterium]
MAEENPKQDKPPFWKRKLSKKAAGAIAGAAIVGAVAVPRQINYNYHHADGADTGNVSMRGGRVLDDSPRFFEKLFENNSVVVVTDTDHSDVRSLNWMNAALTDMPRGSVDAVAFEFASPTVIENTLEHGAHYTSIWDRPISPYVKQLDAAGIEVVGLDEEHGVKRIVEKDIQDQLHEPTASHDAPTTQTVQSSPVKRRFVLPNHAHPGGPFEESLNKLYQMREAPSFTVYVGDDALQATTTTTPPPSDHTSHAEHVSVSKAHTVTFTPQKRQLVDNDRREATDRWVDEIAERLRKNPNAKIVVYAGDAHASGLLSEARQDLDEKLGIRLREMGIEKPGVVYVRTKAHPTVGHKTEIWEGERTPPSKGHQH